MKVINFDSYNMEKFESGLGRHYLIEFYDCNSAKLDDRKLIEKALLEACKLSKATIINSTFHQFAPQGVSGVVVIAESHFSIHTWPENKYAALDFFTCSPSIEIEAALNHLEEQLECEYSHTKDIIRGEEINP